MFNTCEVILCITTCNGYSNVTANDYFKNIILLFAQSVKDLMLRKRQVAVPFVSVNNNRECAPQRHLRYMIILSSSDIFVSKIVLAILCLVHTYTTLPSSHVFVMVAFNNSEITNIFR